MTRLQFNIMRNLNISIGGLKKNRADKGKVFSEHLDRIRDFFC